MFGILGAAGEVRNLGLKGGSVKTTAFVTPVAGGLVGENKGTIRACYTTGNVTCSITTRSLVMAYAGGLVAENSGSGTIIESYATGNVRS